MAIVADSGAVYAIYDSRDLMHRPVRLVVEEEASQLIIPAPVLGEIDYMLRVRIGTAALEQFLSDVDRGSYRIEPFTKDDIQRCRALLAQYRDLDIGLCDASVAATAERLGIDRILTVDERDFRVIRPLSGKPFKLLPADRKRRQVE